jgi:hypothetical protein
MRARWAGGNAISSSKSARLLQEGGASQVWEALHEESRFGSSRCADARLYGNARRAVERHVERVHEPGTQRPVIVDKRGSESANRPDRMPDGRGSELLRWHERFDEWHEPFDGGHKRFDDGRERIDDVLVWDDGSHGSELVIDSTQFLLDAHLYAEQRRDLVGRSERIGRRKLDAVKHREHQRDGRYDRWQQQYV